MCVYIYIFCFFGEHWPIQITTRLNSQSSSDGRWVNTNKAHRRVLSICMAHTQHCFCCCCSAFWKPFVVVIQSLSRVQLFATPLTVSQQASLSFPISCGLFKLMPVESVMPSNHLILVTSSSCLQYCRKRPWCWERLRTGGEVDDRGWDGWMPSLTQWTWVVLTTGDSEGQEGLMCYQIHRITKSQTQLSNNKYIYRTPVFWLMWHKTTWDSWHPNINEIIHSTLDLAT